MGAASPTPGAKHCYEVGIAGECEILTHTARRNQEQHKRRREPAPVRASPLRTETLVIPLVKEKLGADESPRSGLKLTRDRNLPEINMQHSAIAILKGKNRLLADDAKAGSSTPSLARMVPQATLLEASATVDAAVDVSRQSRSQDQHQHPRKQRPKARGASKTEPKIDWSSRGGRSPRVSHR